jgi:ribosomal protein S12 methylthiotransferase
MVVLLYLPTGFPMDVLEIMKREQKICIVIPLQHISDSILKSMRHGTTQEKTTKLLKISVQRSRMYSYNLNRRISGETQRRFNIRMGSNENLTEWVVLPIHEEHMPIC